MFPESIAELISGVGWEEDHRGSRSLTVGSSQKLQDAELSHKGTLYEPGSCVAKKIKNFTDAWTLLKNRLPLFLELALEIYQGNLILGTGFKFSYQPRNH